MVRCRWALNSASERFYHDTEWGVPLHDEQRLFELLVLEGAQAGLSWRTVLDKRPAYRQAFDGFDPVRVAAYDAAKVAALLADSGIIRNRLKIQSAIGNAQAFLDIQAAYGSFDRYLWQFVDGQPLINHWQSHADLPAHTPLSATLSRDLKQRGFRFVGTTICYAFMQAVGMVNDHTVACYRHAELVGYC